MDSGWAGILGSAVGGLGTFSATWLSAYLNRKRPDPIEEVAKVLLAERLEISGRRWHRIDKLANLVGTDEITVRRLLLEIGARGSTENGRYWGLMSINPLTNEKGRESFDPSFTPDPHTEPDE